jgi:predicted transcriptional regulator
MHTVVHYPYMPATSQQIYAYFDKLELHKDVATLYVTLITYGPQTISELSRNAQIERTKVYRLLDDLRMAHLIEPDPGANRNIFKAAPISNIRQLIAQREQAVKTLYSDLEAVEAALVPSGLSSPHTNVHFYRGLDMVKQMFWNETKAEGEVVALLQVSMQMHTPPSFFERWTAASDDAGIARRHIVSDDYLRAQQQWRAAHPALPLVQPDTHYVTPDYFAIRHSTVIYDDVVAYYHWPEGAAADVFGVEMRDPIIAETQRQHFELLWNTSAPLDEMAWVFDSTEA